MHTIHPPERRAPSEGAATALARRPHTRRPISHHASNILTSMLAASTSTYPELLRHNLPAPAATFVGRVHEVAEVKRLLAEHRLVTLTGAGGSGKTRLALQVAWELENKGWIEDSRAEPSSIHYPLFSDGIWWVSLASLTDATEIPQAVATAVGADPIAGVTLLDALIERLHDSQLLLSWLAALP